jgi:hypothetical protein
MPRGRDADCNGILYEHLLRDVAPNSYPAAHPTLLPVPIFIAEGQPMPMVQTVLGVTTVGRTVAVAFALRPSQSPVLCGFLHGCRPSSRGGG